MGVSHVEVQQIGQMVRQHHHHFDRLTAEIRRVIVGQDNLLRKMLVGLLCNGHILLEGVPGLAKTTAVASLARAIRTKFQRLQFTPDLLPADIVGTLVFQPKDGTFAIKKGPIFANLVLADEINRAPAKVQSALLEAMQERQVTIGEQTFPLEEPFLVLATQNPIEQEGTYPLPEAQLDRFMLYVRIGYPEARHEREILRLVRAEARQAREPSGAEAEFTPVSQATLFAARNEVLDLFLAESLEEYLLQLVLATRNPGAYGAEFERWLQYGASPRASIALDRCARARAWLNGRDFVMPEDIQSVAPDVLRHRLILSYEAEAEGIHADRVIAELLRRVAVP